MELITAAELLSKLNSPNGQHLISIMKKDGGKAFSKAVAAAKAGDYQLAKTIIEPLLEGTQAQELAQELGQQHG